MRESSCYSRPDCGRDFPAANRSDARSPDNSGHTAEVHGLGEGVQRVRSCYPGPASVRSGTGSKGTTDFHSLGPRHLLQTFPKSCSHFLVSAYLRPHTEQDTLLLW